MPSGKTGSGALWLAASDCCAGASEVVSVPVGRTEQIAFGANGLDPDWFVSVVAEAFARPGNAHVNGAIYTIVYDAAQLPMDLVARQNVCRH